MNAPAPVILEGHGVRLEPLTNDHHDSLVAAVSDGCLWQLSFAAIPDPASVKGYIENALTGQKAGYMLPWIVRDLASQVIVGSTRYYDMVLPVGRVEIGYTWYGKTWQRSHINTSCKLLLLGHAFEALGCGVVGFRTDQSNLASQRAIAALGAKQDGVIRHHQLRRDGTVRDSIIFSILASEWPDVKRNLELRLSRHSHAAK